MSIHIAFVHFWTLRMRRGVETLVVSLANELTRLDARVSLLTAHQKREPLVKPVPEVIVHSFPTFRYFEATTIVPFYINTLVKIRPDVLITFFADFGEGLTLHLLRNIYQPKHILYLTFPYESAPHRYRAYQRWGWDRSADLILADAGYTAKRGQEILKRQVEVLPSGTDPERFHPDKTQRAMIRQKLGISEDEIVLLNVSALEGRKGTWRVIEALPQIRKTIPKIRYLIMGEGPQRPWLEQRVSELNLEDVVVFYGTTSNLPPIYNASDIFIMLSEAEAGSVALLEAMASRLPVIASKIGGFNEIISAENGRLVNLENPLDITESIIELASNSSLRSYLGKANRKLILEEYSWNILSMKLLNYIDKIS